MEQTQQDLNQPPHVPKRHEWLRSAIQVLFFVGVTIIGAVVTDIFHLLLELAVPFVRPLWLQWAIAGTVALILILLSVYSVRAYLQKKRLKVTLKNCYQAHTQVLLDLQNHVETLAQRDQALAEAFAQRDEALAKRDQALAEVQQLRNELVKEQKLAATMLKVSRVDKSIIDNIKNILPRGGQ